MGWEEAGLRVFKATEHSSNRAWELENLKHFLKINSLQAWECSTVVEQLPSMRKALG